jgi:hypothetical protein
MITELQIRDQYVCTWPRAHTTKSLPRTRDAMVSHVPLCVTTCSTMRQIDVYPPVNLVGWVKKSVKLATPLFRRTPLPPKLIGPCSLHSQMLSSSVPLLSPMHVLLSYKYIYQI